jgi:hypothetical protein
MRKIIWYSITFLLIIWSLAFYFFALRAYNEHKTDD